MIVIHVSQTTRVYCYSKCVLRQVSELQPYHSLPSLRLERIVRSQTQERRKTFYECLKTERWH